MKLSVRFLFILMAVYLFQQVGVAAPPSPSFTFTVSPHLRISERDTVYTKVQEVLRNEKNRGGDRVVATEWKPKKISSVVAVSVLSRVSGYGQYSGNLNASHDGVPYTSNSNAWLRFGAASAAGPIPLYRRVINFPAFVGFIDSPIIEPTGIKRVLTGNGSLSFKQYEWLEGGGGSLPLGIFNNGRWVLQDAGEPHTLPIKEADGTGGYTINKQKNVLCFRYNASPACKTYVMSDSSEHLFSCPTNSDGESCLYSTYWWCNPHEHVYEEGVSLNGNTFTRYDKVTAAVVKKQLYMATMEISGVRGIVATEYPNPSTDPNYFSVTLSASLNRRSLRNYTGSLTVTVKVYYGDKNAPEVETHNFAIAMQ